MATLELILTDIGGYCMRTTTTTTAFRGVCELTMILRRNSKTIAELLTEGSVAVVVHGRPRTTVPPALGVRLRTLTQ